MSIDYTAVSADSSDSQETPTPRSLISRSKASFSLRTSVRYFASSQLLLYNIRYTRTPSPGVLFLYTCDGSQLRYHLIQAVCN